MSASQHFQLPPKPRTSSTGLTIGILIIIALLIGGGIAIHALMKREETPPKVTEVVVQKKVEVPAAKPRKSASSRPATLLSNPVAHPQKLPDDPTSGEWERVQETYRTSPPEVAIVALMDFNETSPTSTFIPTAKTQIDECLDRLWWTRVKMLCDERDSLATKVGEFDKQIGVVKTNGAVAERIAELESEKAPLAEQMELDQQHLAEMKYTDSRTPDLYDDAQLAELRKARDENTYEDWKKKTLAYIERNRGKLPW